MRQSTGSRDERPEDAVDEVQYEPEHAADAPVDAVPIQDLDYTGEGGDGQTERVGNGMIS